MQKKLPFIVIGIILLLVVGGGAYFVLNKKTAQTTSGSESSVASTLKDLLAKNIPQKCTFTDKMEGVEMSGMMYMAGNKVRGDYNNVEEGETMISHMITKDNTTYTWQEGQTTGYMMKFETKKITPQAGKQEEDTGEETKTKQNQTFDPEKIVDYKCSPWITDNSMFDPPKDIKFMDYSSMMAPPMGEANPPQNSQNYCGTCDNLTGEAKDQCRIALKCK